MNIFLRELKANLRSTLFWAGFIIFFIYMGVAKFEAFTASGSDVMVMIDSMPEAVLSAFQLNAFNLTTISGYFGVMYTYYALMSAVFAVLLGNNIIAKEERDKTVEFSLTLPIPRHRLITGKLAAALVHCVIFVLVVWGGSVLFAQPYDPDPAYYGYLRLMMVSLFLVALIFLAIGAMLGAAMKDYKRSGSVAVSLLLGAFLLSIIVGLSEDFQFLKYVTPFQYFNQLTLLNESRFEAGFIWLSIGIVVAAIAAAYYTYQKRDLYI
jgi:ABC-2 type transport system permease protein